MNNKDFNPGTFQAGLQNSLLAIATDSARAQLIDVARAFRCEVENADSYHLVDDIRLPAITEVEDSFVVCRAEGRKCLAVEKVERTNELKDRGHDALRCCRTDLKAYFADVPGTTLVERVDDRVAISHGEKHIEVRVLHEGARIGREVLSDEAMLDAVYAFVHDATIVGG